MSTHATLLASRIMQLMPEITHGRVDDIVRGDLVQIIDDFERDWKMQKPKGRADEYHTEDIDRP